MSSSSPSISLQQIPTPSSPSRTNSEVNEIGDAVWDKIFGDFLSNYSSTIISDREWKRKYKNFHDIEASFMEIKRGNSK